MPGINNPAKFSSTRISTATTTLLKSSPGMLGRVVLDTPVIASIFTIYDGLSAAGTVLAVITVAATTPLFLDFNIAFSVGLCVVSSSTAGAVFAYQ